MGLAFQIREPCSAAEFELYCELRWSVLGKPFGRPRHPGNYEPGTIHLAAWLDGHAIGAGRIYFDSPEQAHLRGIAVEPSCSHQGVGSAIVTELESRVKKLGAARIVVESRETAVGFYQKRGFRAIGEVPENSHPVRHVRMVKDI
jgi:ribosomal protein S18 acetylase RimI-like enzyme